MGFLYKVLLPARLVVRSQEIGVVLTAHGLGKILTNLGFEVGKRGLCLAYPGQRPSVSFNAVVGSNLAQTFMKLGPTFIKLGQLLATRPNLVGEQASEALKVLYDQVRPIPFSKVNAILQKELGRSTAKKQIREIEKTPLASASLGQTHRGTLRDGTPVIVKIQKPGVAKLVKLDLALLEGWARAAQLLYPKYGFFQMFQDFKQATLREIDYRQEAKNMDRFHKNYWRMFSKADVVFPKYYPELSTDKVLVLEPLRGKKLTQLKQGTTVARKAAAIGLSAVLEQIFDHGFFHADPHAGNLFFLEDEDKMGFIDLGLVGQLESEDRKKFLKVLFAILKRDKKKLAKSLFEMGNPSRKTRYERFEQDICLLIEGVKNNGLDKMRMDELIQKLLALAHQNGILIPNRYILMIRSCLAIEGVAKTLDPKISVFDVALPIVTKSLIKAYNPLRWLRRR